MARNIAVSGIGHLSLPNNGGIAFQIASALGDLDPDPAPERTATA